MLNPPPVLAFNTMGDMASHQLNDGTMQSHHSLGAITTPPGSLTSHKRHSIGTMATVGVFLLSIATLLCRVLCALQVLDALHCFSAFQGHPLLLHAPLICPSTALCPRIGLHYLGSSAQCLAQVSILITLLIATPEPCLDDREALPIEDVAIMLGQKAKYLSLLGPATTALT